MTDERKALVTTAEVLSVIEKIHGPSCKLLHYEVEKGTESVQGFLSNILRVTARVEKDAIKMSTKFIVKKFPPLKSQQEFANDLGVFEHEINFFEHCAPILLEQCPDLPVVKCFGTNLGQNIIYMEDLKDLEYVALVRNISDLKDDILSVDHFKIAITALAKLHSASYGIDWLKKCPQVLQEDIVFERKDGVIFKNMIKQSVESNLLPIAEIMYKGRESYIKSIKWLISDDCFQKLTDLNKAKPDEVNVLCHGDSWANNMMFKVDPVTGKPIDVKLIDFQVCRFAPGSTDLIYFLYLCTTSEFRKKHENEILQCYVTAFNESCVKLGKDFVLEWAKFYEGYEKRRLLGVWLAASMRPDVYLKGVLPTGNEDLTEEQFINFFEGGQGPNAALEEYKSNEDFRKEISVVTEEIYSVYQKLLI